MLAFASKAPPNIDFFSPTTPVVEGGVFLASVRAPEGAVSVSGIFQGREILFFPNGPVEERMQTYSAIVGVEYGTGAGKHEIEVTIKTAHDERREKAKVEIQAGAFPSEKLHVPPRTIEPSPKDKKKIELDQKIVAEVYKRRTKEKLWDPPAVMPVESVVTSEFGTFRVYNGKKLNAHLGTDLRAPTGEKIHAPISGKVALARNLFYTGYTVILDHGYGFFTIYGHMSKLNVREGRSIKKGQVLGFSGSTGRASGPHLHWGVNLHGTKIDPMGLFKLFSSEKIVSQKETHGSDFSSKSSQ